MVFKTLHKDDVPQGTKIVDHAWAMKKNPSGIFCACLAAQGFKQEEGKNYSNNDKSLPKITYALIVIIMAMIVLLGN